MESDLKKKPRVFEVGDLKIEDFGKITFKPWEMISIKLESTKDCDITATDWGFYLGSSTNGRMIDNDYRVAIVKNELGKIYINAVSIEKLNFFKKYLVKQESKVVLWLDEI